MNDSLKEQINRLKNEIESLRPLDKEVEGRIQQKFRLDWNYHSNNIEGNSLTFGETKTFLLHGITAAGKPLKDHLDVKGHNDALLLLEDIVKDERPLNETFVRELHKLILHEPYEKQAITPDGQKTSRIIEVGKYKTQPNHVITKTGETFYFAKPEETPALMSDLMEWYNKSIKERNMHPVELAALLHYKFIRIHPFDDGNGRLSRILMNLTLMKFSFPPVIIKTQKKEEYYRALQQADGGDTDFFVDYIASLQLDSLALYLRGARGEHVEEDDDIDKEIALFKAELQKNEKNKFILSKEYFLNTLKPFIIELQTALDNQLSTSFDSLFSENRKQWMINRSAVYSGVFEPNENTLENQIRLPSLPFLITFSWNWVGFKSFGYDAFDLKYSLTIQLHKQNWLIWHGEGDTFNNFATTSANYELAYSEEINPILLNEITKEAKIESLSELKKLSETFRFK